MCGEPSGSLAISSVPGWAADRTPGSPEARRSSRTSVFGQALADEQTQEEERSAIACLIPPPHLHIPSVSDTRHQTAAEPSPELWAAGSVKSEPPWDPVFLSVQVGIGGWNGLPGRPLTTARNTAPEQTGGPGRFVSHPEPGNADPSGTPALPGAQEDPVLAMGRSAGHCAVLANGVVCRSRQERQTVGLQPSIVRSAEYGAGHAPEAARPTYLSFAARIAAPPGPAATDVPGSERISQAGGTGASASPDAGQAALQPVGRMTPSAGTAGSLEDGEDGVSPGASRGGSGAALALATSGPGAASHNGADSPGADPSLPTKDGFADSSAMELRAPFRTPLTARPRQIEMRLPTEADTGIRLRVVERDGSIQVAVRAETPELAVRLREDIGDLVARMQAQGLAGEFWTAGAECRSESQADSPFSRENFEDPPHRRGFFGQGEPREGEPRKDPPAPAWLESLDDPAPGRSQAEKEILRWLRRLWG